MTVPVTSQELEDALKKGYEKNPEQVERAYRELTKILLAAVPGWPKE